MKAIKFSSYLEALAAEIRRNRSGEKSRLRLLAAGARLLESVGYRDLLVEDVCREASLAKGTFYIYFESKEVFLRALMNQYVEFERNTYPSFSATRSTYRGVHDWVSWYEGTFAANAGILRCMIEMSSIDAEAESCWHGRNNSIIERAFEQLVQGLEKAPGPRERELLRLALRAGGSMMDQSLFERYRLGVAVGMKEASDAALMVDLHALLLYRVLYGSEPAAAEVGRVRPLLGLRVQRT
ncbi:MAG: helix-turn-helix domain-containing protein [Steroidobacteraceae bacterium]